MVNAISAGAGHIEFTHLVAWLSTELCRFHSLESRIHLENNTQEIEAVHFQTELSGFLRELGCPHECLVSGPLTDRLAKSHHCLLLLHFLCGELQAARLSAQRHLEMPQKTSMRSEGIVESEIARHLRLVSKAFGLGRPPAELTATKLFLRLAKKANEATKSWPAHFLGQPLLRTRLSNSQWRIVEHVNEVLSKEYRLRRETLLKRLDLTIQSFL